jgi:hypothetical protein
MSPKAEKKRPKDFIDAIDYMGVQAVTQDFVRADSEGDAP